MSPQDFPRLPQPIAHIFFRGCSEQTRTELLARLPFREGDMLSDDLLEAARRAAQTVRERVGIRISDAHSREELLRLPPPVRPTEPEAGVNVTIVDPTSRPQRIRVPGNEQWPTLVDKVPPAPPGTGIVRLAIVIGNDGAVIDAISLAGPESLVPAALGAVRLWRYQPALLNGSPVEVQTTVEVDFRAN